MRVLTVSLLCGLLELMTPVGEREGLRRAVRLLSALFLLGVLLQPLSSIGEAIFRLDLGSPARQWEMESGAKYEEWMEEKLTAATSAQLEEDLYALLESELGVSREDCRITVGTESDGEGLRVSHVWIALRGEAVLIDPRKIETRVTEAVGCPCTVSLG